MLCLRGYRAAYIGQWDEPGPSDQTDFYQWHRLDLNGGLELTYKADRDLAQGTVGRPRGMVGPPSFVADRAQLWWVALLCLIESSQLDSHVEYPF